VGVRVFGVGRFHHRGYTTPGRRGFGGGCGGVWGGAWLCRCAGCCGRLSGCAAGGLTARERAETKRPRVMVPWGRSIRATRRVLCHPAQARRRNPVVEHRPDRGQVVQRRDRAPGHHPRNVCSHPLARRPHRPGQQPGLGAVRRRKPAGARSRERQREPRPRGLSIEREERKEHAGTRNAARVERPGPFHLFTLSSPSTAGGRRVGGSLRSASLRGRRAGGREDEEAASDGTRGKKHSSHPLLVPSRQMHSFTL